VLDEGVKAGRAWSWWVLGTEVVSGNLERRDHVRDLDEDGRIILKWII
jgi:hypothetical protein